MDRLFQTEGTAEGSTYEFPSICYLCLLHAGLSSPCMAFQLFQHHKTKKEKWKCETEKNDRKKWRLIQTIWKIKDASKFILQLSCKPREFAAVSSQFLELLWNYKSHNQSKITAYNKVGHFLLQKNNQLIIKITHDSGALSVPLVSLNLCPLA